MKWGAKITGVSNMHLASVHQKWGPMDINYKETEEKVLILAG